MISTSSSVSISKQCQLLSISRSGYHYRPKSQSKYNLELMNQIDRQFIDTPYYGVRQMTYHLRNMGYCVNPKRVRRLMRLMGLQAIYQSPKTTHANPDHQVYPYLLRNKVINQVNQVWCSDITYIQMKKGFLYLVAVMDWYSRKVLSWRLSNNLDSQMCIESLNQAISVYGKPEIFNTDQGSQYTSCRFTQLLTAHQIDISMDGKGAWRDNVFIERLWRSLKYECVYLHEFDSGWDARTRIGNWIDHYNALRPHGFHKGKTPDMIYFDQLHETA